MLLLASARTYRVWTYRVSHDQLLIRSSRNSEHSLNSDLMFDGVMYMALPSLMHGIEVYKEPRESARRSIPSFRELDFTFRLRSSNQDYWVAAGGLRVEENELGLWETHLQWEPIT